MNKEELIDYLEDKILKYHQKCRKAKIEFIKTYYLGCLYKSNETYRRLTGKEYADVTTAYWYHQQIRKVIEYEQRL